MKQVVGHENVFKYFYFDNNRFKKIVHSPSSWKQNEDLVTKSTLALASVILYALIVTWINAHFELQSFNVYNVCLEREGAKLPKPTFNFIMVLTPVLSVMLLTNSLDLSSYFWLKNRIQVTSKQINQSKKGSANQVQENHQNNIPIHASVICSLLFMLHIAGFVVLGAQKGNYSVHHDSFVHQMAFWYTQKGEFYIVKKNHEKFVKLCLHSS